MAIELADDGICIGASAGVGGDMGVGVEPVPLLQPARENPPGSVAVQVFPPPSIATCRGYTTGGYVFDPKLLPIRMLLFAIMFS